MTSFKLIFTGVLLFRQDYLFYFELAETVLFVQTIRTKKYNLLNDEGCSKFPPKPRSGTFVLLQQLLCGYCIIY